MDEGRAAAIAGNAVSYIGILHDLHRHILIGQPGIVEYDEHLGMVSRIAILHKDVSAKQHRLAEGAAPGKIVIGHQVALVVCGARKPVIFEERRLRADMKVLRLCAIVDIAITQEESTAIDIEIVRR